MTRTAVLKLMLLALLVAGPVQGAVQAQSYPTKPLKFIVPFPPGGLVDVTGRLVAQKLSEVLGQPIVIENRTGASGIIGSDAVAKSTPDGYTLLFTTGDFLTTPNAVPLPFNPDKDLLPITMVARAPLVLVASEASPITTVSQMIAAAKASPGSVAYASSGTGTINHLAGEWMSIETGIKLLHVPYRGGLPAATDLAAGTVPLGVLTPSAVSSLVDAKKIRVLALMTKERATFVPDWPTLAEQGIANIDAALWVGLFAPGGTPAPIAAKIAEEVARLLKDETVRKRLNDLGTDPSPISQQAFVDRIHTDAARYKKVAEEAGIKIEH